MNMQADISPYARGKDFRLPGASNRTVVLGRTGSGKTVFMKWLLSRQNIDTMPWIVIDHKRNKEYADIPHARSLKLGEHPREPGVYIMPADFRHDEKLDTFLHECMERGQTGLLFDEGASVPQREPRFVGLKTVLAQGRSKRVPVIFGSQRPRFINKSLLSEGDFFARLHLSYEDDKAYVNQFMPKAASGDLDEYHAHWYDVGRNRLFVLSPVSEQETNERFYDRLRPQRRLL